MGLVEGREITIDGNRYLIRITTGGENEDDQGNEWDRLIDLYGDNNEILHYDNMYSWCSNAPAAYRSYRVIRGYGGARRWGGDDTSNYNVHVGWRPVLEPLNTDK